MNLVELTGETVHGFTSAFLMSKFDNPVPTPPFHLELWDLLCSSHERVAIAAPRGHAKSTACTHSYVLANVCFRARKHVLIVSDTEGQAKDFLRDIRNEMVENELLMETFGVEGLEKDNEAEIVIKFTDGHRARILAKGSEQKMRGIKWRNTRPDLIVCDDLENDEIVMNDERREKFKKWFLNALLPALSKTGIVRVVGTILHLDSLLEDLMPELNHPCTVTTELRDSWDDGAYREWCLDNDKTYEAKDFVSYRYRAHNSDFSSVLWPEQYDQKRLSRIRAGYIARGFPEGYSQEYLNYPIDDTNAYFKKQDFLPLDGETTPLRYYVGVDLAISQKDSRAYSVFAIAGVDAWGNIKVVEINRFRGDAFDIIDEFFRVHERYDPDIFFVEQENIARTLGPVIEKAMEERGIYFYIESMTASQDKPQRARALQARMRAGKVQFDTDADWYLALFNEMTQFPRSKYMDQVDALAWIALGLQSIIEAPTAREQLDMEWEDEYESTSTLYDMGRSGVTGY